MLDAVYALDLARSGRISRALVLRALVPMVAADAARSWVHIAYEGEWKGHPRGPFELSGEKFQAMIDRFNAKRNPTPVDYEHASVKTDGRNGVPASGWIHRLELRSNGLWAEVEWTARAAEMIRAGEYRYCSGVFIFDDVDEQSGDPVDAQLFNLALTNTPFIDGQVPITLAVSKRVDGMDASQIVAQIAKALGLDEKSSAEQIMSALEGLTKLRDAQSGETKKSDAKPEKKPEAESAATATAASKPVELAADPTAPAAPVAAPSTQDPGTVAAAEEALGLLRQALKLDANADAAAVLAALRANLDAISSTVGGGAESAAPAMTAASRAVVTAFDSTIRALRSEVAGLKTLDAERVALRRALKIGEKDDVETVLAARAKTEAEARVERLIVAGKLLDVERGTFVELALSNSDAFDLIERSLGQRVPTGEHAPAPAPAESSALSMDAVDEKRVEVMMSAHKISRAQAEARVRAVKNTQVRLIGAR